MKKVNFIPSGNNVLIEAPEKETKTKGGIIVPEDTLKEYNKSNQKFLTVAAVGSEVKEIEAGDRVLLRSGNHEVVEIDSVAYLLGFQGIISGKLAK